MQGSTQKIGLTVDPERLLSAGKIYVTERLTVRMQLMNLTVVSFFQYGASTCVKIISNLLVSTMQRSKNAYKAKELCGQSGTEQDMK